MSGVDNNDDDEKSKGFFAGIYEKYEKRNKTLTGITLGHLDSFALAFLDVYIKQSKDQVADTDVVNSFASVLETDPKKRIKARFITGLKCFFGLNLKTNSFDFKNFGAPIFRTLYNFIKLPVFLLRSVDFGCRKIIYSEYKDKPVVYALSRISLLVVVPIHVVALAAYSILNPIVKAPVWIKNGIQSVVASFVAMVRSTNKTADSFRNSEDIICDTKLRSSSTNSTEWNNPFRPSVDKTGNAEVLPPIKEDAKERSLSSTSTSSVLSDLEDDDLCRLSVSSRSPSTVAADFDRGAAEDIPDTNQKHKPRVNSTRSINLTTATDGDSSEDKKREENEGGLREGP